MQSNKEAFAKANRSGFPCSYFGDHEDWLQVIGQSRDSNCLEQSNFRSMERILRAISSDDVDIERASHWACGWVETLIINTSNEKLVAEAQGILDALTDWPIVDDEDWSALQYEMSEEYWDRCSVKERIEMAKSDRYPVRFAQMKFCTLSSNDTTTSRRILDRIQGDI